MPHTYAQTHSMLPGHPSSERFGSNVMASRCDRELVRDYCRAFVLAMEYARNEPQATDDTYFAQPLHETRTTDATRRVEERVSLRDLPEASAPRRRQNSPPPRRPVPLPATPRPFAGAAAAPPTAPARMNLPAPLPRVAAGPPRETHKVCKSFRMTGTCRFGSRCLYHHTVATDTTPAPPTPAVTVREPTAETATATVSVTVSPPSTTGGALSSETATSTRTSASLSPTCPHSVRACSGSADSRDDQSSDPSRGSDRWNALRVRSTDGQHAAQSLSAVHSTKSKSRSSSGGKVHTRVHSPPPPPPPSQACQGEAGHDHDGGVVLNKAAQIRDETETLSDSRRRGMRADAPSFVPGQHALPLPTPHHQLVFTGGYNAVPWMGQRFPPLPPTLAPPDAAVAWCPVFLRPIPAGPGVSPMWMPFMPPPFVPSTIFPGHTPAVDTPNQRTPTPPTQTADGGSG